MAPPCVSVSTFQLLRCRMLFNMSRMLLEFAELRRSRKTHRQSTEIQWHSTKVRFLRTTP
eukprot:13087191-Alexandrium_andersonii.AAC.1